MTKPCKKPKLLVVDDEVEYCSLIQECFSEKYEVRVTYDGEEAIKEVHEFLPDCVLLDVKMPKMNGITALGLIKSSHPKTQVIMVSASGSIRVAEESLKRGAFDYILKPVDLKELEDKIESALGKPE